MKKTIAGLAVSLTVLLGGAGAGASPGAQARGPRVILMPAHNYSDAGYHDPACYTAGWSAAACIGGQLQVINQIHRLEGAAPMVLPTNWARLSVPEQLFVLTDLERVDRGLPPYLGLNAALSAVAQVGAVRNTDPAPPARLAGWAAGSTWADGPSALTADYGWMYDDGWGGSRATTFNLSCPSAHSPGCWGHRDVLLGWSPAEHMGTGLGCTTCVMGTGYVPNSLTTLIVNPMASVPLYFTWAQDVLPYLASRPWARYVNLLVPQMSLGPGTTMVAPIALRHTGYVSLARAALQGLGAGRSVFADVIEESFNHYGTNYAVGFAAAFARTLPANGARVAARDVCLALSPPSSPAVSPGGVPGGITATCDQGKLAVVTWVKANILAVAVSYSTRAGVGGVSVPALESAARTSWESAAASGEPL